MRDINELLIRFIREEYDGYEYYKFVNQFADYVNHDINPYCDICAYRDINCLDDSNLTCEDGVEKYIKKYLGWEEK